MASKSAKSEGKVDIGWELNIVLICTSRIFISIESSSAVAHIYFGFDRFHKFERQQ